MYQRRAKRLTILRAGSGAGGIGAVKVRRELAKMGMMAVDPGDPVPDDVLARARAAFEAPAAPGAALAPLVYDSLVEGATDADRFWLVFQHPTAQLQLSIRARHDASGLAGRWDLAGRVDPPAPLRADLEMEQSAIALVEPAPHGEFTFRDVPGGTMRVSLVDTTGLERLQTDWFLVGARTAG